MPSPSFLSAALASPSDRFTIQNIRTGCILATNVELAIDSVSRRKGLLGRPGLPSGSALIIAPTSAIHTFFMEFAIDLIFVHRNGAVRKTHRNVKPWRVAIAFGAFAAIELPGGSLGSTIRSSDATRGERLQLVPA